MPQAIDFSLATPRIRPRLPAMIARGLAVSLIIVLRRSAGTAALRALEKSARSWAEIGLAREAVSQPRSAPRWDAASPSQLSTRRNATPALVHPKHTPSASPTLHFSPA